jgi:hypothetical protein
MDPRSCSTQSTRLGRAIALGALALVLQPLASCVPAGQDPTDVNDPLVLPFTVSDYFTPTGAWGDAATPGLMNMTTDCGTRAPAPGGPYGDCFAIAYVNPTATYGGVYYQFPANNWGTNPGRRVSPGAMQVTLWARADVSAPIKMSFGVGGIGIGQGTEYVDSVGGGVLNATVTSDWQELSFPVTGTYDWVLSGFHWSISSAQPVTFYIDSVQWH